MNKALSIAIFSLATSIAAHGASIVAAAETANAISIADGSLVPQGNQIRIGVFNLLDSQIQANSGNLSFLASNFVQLGSGVMGQGYGLDGVFTITSAAFDSTALGVANGQISLWVFKTALNNTPLGDYSNVLQHGIFYADKASLDNWRVRPTGPADSTNVDITDLTTGATALNAAARVVIGAFPKAPNDPIFDKPTFSLAPVVPEPTSIALLGFAFAGLLAHRRRK